VAKYRVIGRNAVEGVPTGGTVELDGDVSRLIEGGHIEVIAARKTQKNINSEMSEDG
jgi:hypothetical protein